MNGLKKITLPLLIGIPVMIGCVMLIFRTGTSEGGGRGTGAGFKKLGLVRVEGTIFESETAVRQLKEFGDDHLIAGVLLRVESPGGATAPSQEIFSAVSKLKTRKPVIVSMGSIAASGGYYIACPANRIFADPGTLTGSIGVIMTFPVYKELAKKIGFEMRTFKSGAYKDLANPYRTMTDKEQRMLQALLDDTHDQFITDVANARSIERDSLLPIADGRIFTGRQALANKLIDTLGTYEEALSYLRKITGLGTNTRIVNKGESAADLRRWLVKEMVGLFPALYKVFTPIGAHCLTSFEQ